MLRGDAGSLLSAMSQYGYSLLHPDQMADPNELLTALSQSDDVRVLEGFPVVLANALQKRPNAVDLRAAENLLKDEPARERFRRLTALSFYLLGVFGYENLRPAGDESLGEGSQLMRDLRNHMEHSLPLPLGKKTLDPGRVRKTFLNYFAQPRESDTAENKAQLREDFRREFNLSLFFAPKQRDLLQKKLLALADPDLHRLAQKALQ